MIENSILDELCLYLAYPIIDDNYSITKLFNSYGLPIKSKKIDPYMHLIGKSEAEFKKWLNDNYYKRFRFKYICILKIPLYYLGYLKPTEEITPCMPIIKTYFDYINGETNYIVPELILGIYNTKTKEYKSNNYNPLFNPCGLQFTDEQIDIMKLSNVTKIADYALARRSIPYWTLLNQDMENGVLNQLIKYYEELANTKENKHILEKKQS